MTSVKVSKLWCTLWCEKINLAMANNQCEPLWQLLKGNLCLLVWKEKMHTRFEVLKSNHDLVYYRRRKKANKDMILIFIISIHFFSYNYCKTGGSLLALHLKDGHVWKVADTLPELSVASTSTYTPSIIACFKTWKNHACWLEIWAEILSSHICNSSYCSQWHSPAPKDLWVTVTPLNWQEIWQQY